jgi:hypothetical protein
VLKTTPCTMTVDGFLNIEKPLYAHYVMFSFRKRYRHIRPMGQQNICYSRKNFEGC